MIGALVRPGPAAIIDRDTDVDIDRVHSLELAVSMALQLVGTCTNAILNGGRAVQLSRDFTNEAGRMIVRHNVSENEMFKWEICRGVGNTRDRVSYSV